MSNVRLMPEKAVAISHAPSSKKTMDGDKLAFTIEGVVNPSI